MLLRCCIVKEVAICKKWKAFKVTQCVLVATETNKNKKAIYYKLSYRLLCMKISKIDFMISTGLGAQARLCKFAFGHSEPVQVICTDPRPPPIVTLKNMSVKSGVHKQRQFTVVTFS